MLYRFAHKTGSYGVSIIEEDDNQVLVQIEQVIKHPKQGDLHHPNETENVFFHAIFVNGQIILRTTRRQ